jgi:acetyltransferase-like isoleucine patch superfamily enzyme
MNQKVMKYCDMYSQDIMSKPGRKLLNRICSLLRIRLEWPRVKVAKGVIIEGNLNNIVIGSDTIIESGAVLSTKYGGRIILGHNCSVHRNGMLMTYGGDICLGDYCSVNPNTILYGHGGLTVGNYVRFAANSVVIPTNHTFERTDIPIHSQPLKKTGIKIGSDVWIGAGVCILDGVRIGDGVVVGAGSIVTGDLKPFSVNVGTPARMVKMRK